MIRDPKVLMQYTKQQLINYIVIDSMPREFSRVHAELGKGYYNTRSLLVKIGINPGTVSRYIAYGIKNNFLRQEWHFDPNTKRTHAILHIVPPTIDMPNPEL